MEIWFCFCWWNISSTESYCSANYGLFPEWPQSLGLMCCVTSGLVLFIVAAFYFFFYFFFLLCFFVFVWCVWLTWVSRAVCAPDWMCETGDYTLGNFVGGNILGSSPKMLARRLEPPGGSIYMYYGVSYHMYAFLVERTFLVIHCKTRLWSLLLILIGSWTEPSLWSQYSIFS